MENSRRVGGGLLNRKGLEEEREDEE